MPTVLIFAIDGLQPSQVTEELMPNLAAFASDGVFFDNHHPVYPSVTRVNAASIMTGCYPGRHGLVGNTLVIREYDRTRAFSALVDELMTVVEKTGRLLFRPTLAEIISGHGKRFVTVGTGSSGNSFVHNPKPHAGHGQEHPSRNSRSLRISVHLLSSASASGRSGHIPITDAMSTRRTF